jgi:hypothetical protein
VVLFGFVVFSSFVFVSLYHCVSCHSAQGAVAIALFMCALVACLAAYADADAVALARAAAVAFVAFVALAMAAWRTIASAIIWPECATVRLRELFEQQHALMQCAKLAVNSRHEWLNEQWNSVLHVLYHAQ